MPVPQYPTLDNEPKRPVYKKHNKSFDALRNGQWSSFNASESKHKHFQFAEGDVPKSKVLRLYFFLINTSIITRWAIFVLPIAGVLAIPLIVSVTTAPDAELLRVRLLWWSIWLETLWVGWWVSWAASKIIPWVAKHTVAVIVPNGKQMIDYFVRCERYLAAVGWTVACWAVFNFVVLVKFSRDHSDSSYSTLSVIAQVHAGIIICASILAGEKILIQLIAYNFHRTSYDDRIREQKFQVKVLAALYARSRDLGRSDTLDGFGRRGKEKGVKAGRVFRKAAREAKEAAANATTALGNVASEIAGSSVLQPNSPMSMVTNALGSGKKTRHLARRLYYSFCPPYRTSLVQSDIESFFPDLNTAEEAFAVLDKDVNGDVSLEELEMACFEVHRERLALTSSMRDLDSAVAALDKILMSIYVVAACLIIVAMLDVKFSTLVTSAGSLVLGLSWLIGTTAQEILASIIFLFIKHPYDVGDRVKIDDFDMTVKEINLLYSIFKRIDGTVTQAPHVILNQKYVHNVRRSGSTSEDFNFNVAFDTTFDQIEDLRSRMLHFLKSEKRDFHPICDINIVDLPDQEKMTLSTSINYKSNWQNISLYTQRRVKWMVAMKIALSESKIFGPAGDPDAPPIPARYMKVPYETPGKVEEMPAPLPDDARTADLRRAASMALNGGRRALIHRMDAEEEALFHSGLETVPRENTDDSFNMPMPYGNAPQGTAPSMPTPEHYDVDSDRATPAQLEAGRVRIQSPEPIRSRPQQQEHQQRGRQDYEMRRI
ncbi:hypothetical protein WALSEDRAFT_21049 [Wallemia mellicola CBS 633.66]|uniref:EF-hand domain-containing protein n=1 Tax=Wallemia mellicola (strain ATCC MYA-4683 / CBS 633.66) TaxID=671144 RepID=I4Y8F5_WALMC|nr:hypothetical protein WALSEDRAFT_21049 [Wallemia mellicola CBS 633.66]EIM20247.1 hypothetical protein WALSEDRAFT_21049 [Wallemia mellicola CBS 633.66]|eukprot:XP_006959735.1 hypothetical protein WALSEDRAFT_21049 [Wallemia mellicola CBS 633.66]